MSSNDEIFKLIVEEDELTWQTILYDLVKTEQMDPWDIDISLLTQKYMRMLKQLKEMNFRVSGKVLLAAAILLKIKSNRLVGEDLDVLDRLISASEQGDEEVFFDILEETHEEASGEGAKLIPRTPQPRKRKVSIYDLVDALQQALEVKRRRVLSRTAPLHFEIPKKGMDITLVVRDVYKKIKDFFVVHKKSKLTFSNLVPSQNKEDKVYTFIPLLYLSQERKINLWQYEHFGEIEVELLRTKRQVDKELGLI